KAEEQREVTVNALALQRLSRLDAFPGAADLDQDPLTVDARSAIQLDQRARLVDGAGGIEAEARVDLGRDASGNQLQNLQAEIHGQLVHEDRGLGGAVRALLGGMRGGLLHQAAVLRQLSRFQQE